MSFLPVVSDSLRTEVIKIKILKYKKHYLPLKAALTLNLLRLTIISISTFEFLYTHKILGNMIRK